MPTPTEKAVQATDLALGIAALVNASDGVDFGILFSALSQTSLAYMVEALVANGIPVEKEAMHDQILKFLSLQVEQLEFLLGSGAIEKAVIAQKEA